MRSGGRLIGGMVSEGLSLTSFRFLLLFFCVQVLVCILRGQVEMPKVDGLTELRNVEGGYSDSYPSVLRCCVLEMMSCLGFAH